MPHAQSAGPAPRKRPQANRPRRCTQRDVLLGEQSCHGRRLDESDADDWQEVEPQASDEDWEALERYLLDAFDDDEPEPDLDELGWYPPPEDQDDA